MLRFTAVGAGLLVMGLTAAASAADLSAPVYTKAPVAAPVMPYNWTGCHIGGNLGGGVSDNRTTNLVGISTDHDADGFVGGGQIGCDYQFADGWVAGIEGRADWTGLKKTHAGSVVSILTGATFPSQFTFNNDFLASATARLGHTFADRWLVFVRGGAAWTRVKADDAFTNAAGIAVDPRASLNRTGWTAGTGVEWAFASHWSAVLEYNYYDFGTTGLTLTDTTVGLTTVSFAGLRNTIQTGTVGVNYHF